VEIVKGIHVLSLCVLTVLNKAYSDLQLMYLTVMCSFSFCEDVRVSA